MKKYIIHITLIILVIFIIVFTPEIKLYNTTITQENYQYLIEKVYTSKLPDEKKTVIMTKLLLQNKQYIGKKVKDLI